MGKFKKYDELIVVEDISFSGGGTKSIINYYNHHLIHSRKKIALVRLVYKNSFLRLIYYAFFSEKIIINSLFCFKYWIVILVCYLKKESIIYIHDAAPHTEPFKKEYPFKFKLFLKLLQKRKVGFVSEWQAKYWLKMVDIPRYKIIYNNINLPYEKKEDNIITIAMIGYQSKYKNVTFFSTVADEAKKRNLPYQFIWIGGEGGEMKQMYHSPNVTWLGDQENVMDIINNIDLLFFTSYGDTFGLAIIEAISKGKRIVSYIENGLAPFISQLKGCRVYKSFNEELILNTIEDVLKEPVDLVKHKELAYELCAMENFEKRLKELVNL